MITWDKFGLTTVSTAHLRGGLWYAYLAREMCRRNSFGLIAQADCSDSIQRMKRRGRGSYPAGLERTGHPLFRLPFSDAQVAFIQTQKSKLRYALQPSTSPYNEYRRVGLVFVHITKTAGTALREAIYGPDVGIDQIPHRSAEFLRRVNPKEYAAYTSVAVLRNPATRLASLFNFLKAGMAASTLDEFVERYISMYPDFEAYRQALEDPKVRATVPWRSQTSWISDMQGNIIVDLLLCQEHLDEGVRELEAHLDRKINLGVTNVSPGKKVPVPQALIDELFPGDRALWQRVFDAGHLWLTPRQHHIP